MSMHIESNPLKRIASDGSLAGPPPKVARYVAPPTGKQSTLSFQKTSRSREFQPSIKYTSHPMSRRNQFTDTPYPLDLLPNLSWNALHHSRYHNQYYSKSKQTPPHVLIACPECAKTHTASLHFQKLFYVAERLLSKPHSMSLIMRQRSEELNLRVNYQLGILDQSTAKLCLVGGGLRSQDCLYYPFKSEFEMRAALKLLEKAAVMNEGGWKIWLDMVDHLPIAENSIGLPPQNEVKNAGSRHNPAHRVPPLPVPPSSSVTVPLVLPRNASVSKTTAATVCEVGEIDLTGDVAKLAIRQGGLSQPPAEPPKIPEPEFSKSRNTSFRTLTDLYRLLDLIERTSYCAARFHEAYAEFLKDDLCADCWFKHNIFSDDKNVAAKTPAGAFTRSSGPDAALLKKYRDQAHWPKRK